MPAPRGVAPDAVLASGTLSVAALQRVSRTLPILFVAVRGLAPLREPLLTRPIEVGKSLLGGVVSIAAYGIVIWALQSGAMGTVSALRETSVVFAVLIGRTFLREAVSGTRWVACIIVALGGVCLGL